MNTTVSRPIGEVVCSVCSKEFLKPLYHINQNLKLGHNFYCSKKCLSQYSKRGRILNCENPVCNEEFYRAPKDVMPHNFCSSSCAATVNNQRYPKWPKRYCAICKKEFKNRESKYCSSKCGWTAFKKHREPKYNSTELQAIIKTLAKELGRCPSRRELGNMSHMAIREFGSWNNAVLASRLEPHRSDDNRMYRRTRTKARDGHVCDSVSEALVDNWLHKNKIKHSRNTKYPTTNHKADWSIKGGKIFIEYFGLAKDSPRYDREIKLKKRLCKKNGIKLVEIYPKDLYPTNLLDKTLHKLK